MSFDAGTEDPTLLKQNVMGKGGWASTSQLTFLENLGAKFDKGFSPVGRVTYVEASKWIEELRQARFTAPTTHRAGLYDTPPGGYRAEVKKPEEPPPEPPSAETQAKVDFLKSRGAIPKDYTPIGTPKSEAPMSANTPQEPSKEPAKEVHAEIVPAPKPPAPSPDRTFIPDAEMMNVLRNVVAPGASDAELHMLAMMGQQLGLDVLRGQVKYARMGGRGVIMVGIDGLRAIAEASGEYDGQDPPEFQFEGDKLISATVKVYRKGMSHAVSATAYFVEYVGSGPTWAKMPRLMLSKVAESLALRKAFPRGMSSLYEPSEMDQARV